MAAAVPSIFRVMVSVDNIEVAALYYAMLLDIPGRRVSAGRHYFDAGSVILACYDPEADEDETLPVPNPEPIYFAVTDIDSFFQRCLELGLIGPAAQVRRQSWGERSLYMQDPFGNPLCFVEEATRFTGHDQIEERTPETPIS